MYVYMLMDSVLYICCGLDKGKKGWEGRPTLVLNLLFQRWLSHTMEAFALFTATISTADAVSSCSTNEDGNCLPLNMTSDVGCSVNVNAAKLV